MKRCIRRNALLSDYLTTGKEGELFSLEREEHLRCIAALHLLEINPYPGYGGDKEKLQGKMNRYRIHIGRSYSAIYRIDKEKMQVGIIAFGTIGDIHKKY